MFVQRFLCYFGLQLHDLTPHEVAGCGSIPTSICGKGFFQLSLNKDGNGFMQRIRAAVIQLCNNMKLWYLDLSIPTMEKG